MTDTPRFDDNIAMERLEPFFKYCRELGDGVGELETAQFLLVLATAVSDECKYDTIDENTGERVKDRFGMYLNCATAMTRQAIRDLSRDRETRRLEVVQNLTDYQREMLGIELPPEEKS